VQAQNTGEMMARDASPKPEESGFLSRWSQRKQALRKGEVLAEPVQSVDEVNLKQKQSVAGIHTAQSAPDSSK
jgi:hypothetical protein